MMVIALVFVLIASGLFYLGIYVYQPFKHIDWKQKINGYAGEVIAAGSSIYIANLSYHPTSNNPNSDNYSYSVYKLNASTGRIEWISSPLFFKGLQSQYFNDGGPTGLKIWIVNNTLFAMDGNENPNAPGSFTFSEYTIYSINTSGGAVTGTQNISFPYMTEANNTAYYPVVLTKGSEMYFSQVHSVGFAALPKYSNTSFMSYQYELNNRTYELTGNDSVKIPTINVYGWGNENSLIANKVQFTYIKGMNQTIVNDLSNDKAHLVNITPQAISESQNSIYVATISNSTLCMHEFNAAHLNGTLIFNYSNPLFDVNLSFSPITLTVLPNGFFLIDFYHQGGHYVNNSFVMQIDCKLIALNVNGNPVWTYNYSSYPYLLQMRITTGNTVFVSILNYQDNSFIYPQAKFALINYTDGQIMWSHTYLSSTSGGNSAFMEPANFNGMLLVTNDKVLFKIGNSVELAALPR